MLPFLFGGLDLEQMDDLTLCFQRASDLYLLACEQSDLFLIVETVDLALRRQHEIASQVPHAVRRAGALGPTRSLGFQHLGVRPGQRMDVQCALGVGNLPLKSQGFFISGVREQGSRYQPADNRNSGLSHPALPPGLHGVTSTLMFMPS